MRSTLSPCSVFLDFSIPKCFTHRLGQAFRALFQNPKRVKLLGMPKTRLRSFWLVSIAFVQACYGGGLPEGWRQTPPGIGPRVVWNFYTKGLPELPLPNDVATWPDPSSATGRRINASENALTKLERNLRKHFNLLDGWGTYSPITIPFDGPIDTQSLLRRQGPGRMHARDFREHAIYLIDLESGLPVPLDLGSGSHPYTTLRQGGFFDHDPRGDELNLLFESVEEDLNRNGVLDVGEDSDFDGVLDHPNTPDGILRGTPLEGVDRMLWFYERETNTLVLRTFVPLLPRRKYAVVLTERLIGANGHPVRSPFHVVHHPSQVWELARLPEIFKAHPELYGDLAELGWDGVAFAWSFSTQSTTDELDAIRDGLDGKGPFAWLAQAIPFDAAPLPLQGGGRCGDPGPKAFIAPGERVRSILRRLASFGFGLSEQAAKDFENSYARLSHVVALVFETPRFLGDPEKENLEEAFDLDLQSGRARWQRESVRMLLLIPTETASQKQPFPVLLYAHGHTTSAAEVLLFGGFFLQHGMAVAAIDAPGHGLSLSPALGSLLRSLLSSECLEGLARAILLGRAPDLDGDGAPDSGPLFWTAYAAHTRDSVRQSAIDQLTALRVLRAFNGIRLAKPLHLPLPVGRSLLGAGAPSHVDFDGDYNRDGRPDLAGDFDGNGVPDLGGPAVPYRMAGTSMGGILSALVAGLEPTIDATVSFIGGGGLGDIAIRTNNPVVRAALHLRIMGPFVVTERGGNPQQSACRSDQFSVQVVGAFLGREEKSEIACVDGDLLGPRDVLLVRNLSKGLVGCAGATKGEAGRFRVAIPSDIGDRWVIEIYRDALGAVDFSNCKFSPSLPPARVIDRWESALAHEECERCSRWGNQRMAPDDPLRSPAEGMALRRQSPKLRRLFTLAQAALERGDPINYVRRVFLDPISLHPRSLLIIPSAGDPDVPVSTAYSLARAAGILPFLPADAPPHLTPYRAPSTFEVRHGFASPNDVLIAWHATEGIARFGRHPVPGAAFFLVDIDDLSDGRAAFRTSDGKGIPIKQGGVQPPRLSPPLRWSRLSSPLWDSDGTWVWEYQRGAPTSALVTTYFNPYGAHAPSTLFDPDTPFDAPVYTFGLMGRYLSTGGRDIPYLSNPSGHHCLEDLSCPFFESAP
ncbi:MAG: hypothetical protein NZM37_00390 [Sandaracinaceae bacterium]|nr:hypothetical protein [Sandaracinaceae bacterium]